MATTPSATRLEQRSTPKRFGSFARICIIHVLEYLWAAAREIHGEGSPESQAWVTKRFRYLLEGVSATRVAAGIRKSATKHGVQGRSRKAVETCAAYLCKYAEYLRYAEYIAKGYPIATGVIEGACRHLVKDRMDITGARWSLEGAEAVLKLRALRASGDFHAYWSFHEKQELQRNHLARYEGGAIGRQLSKFWPQTPSSGGSMTSSEKSRTQFKFSIVDDPSVTGDGVEALQWDESWLVDRCDPHLSGVNSALVSRALWSSGDPRRDIDGALRFPVDGTVESVGADQIEP